MANSSELTLPSYDFIAGLVTTIGSFLWVKQKNSEIPVFQLKVQSKDYDLLVVIKDKLEIKETIHKYLHQDRQYCLLLIRSRRTIENKIIPVFDGRLLGQKQIQFDLWKKKYFEKKLNFVYHKQS
ncbi:MAG TPA: LAGLIDADG family homing endonuclease [Candidatus Udaeobacter sp.]|nr:LAGLIDADG family homing endonuclease [Candidatus Udaeobacter sp.]